MAKIKLPPYLVLRDGRPRWIPGAGVRAKGYKGRDLKDENGEWLTRGAAIEAAEKLNAATRAGTKHNEPVQLSTERSCAALWEKYKASNKFKKLAPKTKDDYQHKLCHWLDAGFANAPARIVTKPQLFGYYEQAQKKHGLSMANGIIAVVRRLFSYGELTGWLPAGSNPAKGLEIDQAPPRLAIWLPQQIDIFMQTADTLTHNGAGFKSIGDAFLLALHSAQRVSDVRTIPDRIFADDRICLSQLKTKALIDVKMTPQVKTRVLDMRARRHAGTVTSLDGFMIIDETTGREYKEEQFNKRFRKVRAAAAEALPKMRQDGRWSGGAAPLEIADLHFADTRDTAVTRLAMAGNDAAHIAAVSGHSLVSITRIMRHYLALNRSMADKATDRVVAWLEREGIAI